MSDSMEDCVLDDPRLAVNAWQLTRKFGRTTAVDHIDLQIPRGSIVGLLGDNGAGKSTTLRMLVGLLHQNQGSLRILGCNPRIKGAELRARIGYVPEDRRLWRGATVRRMLRYAARFYLSWNRRVEAELLERYRIDPDQKIGALSRGGLAKLYLLMALAPQPELLVLDEATGGIDAIARREILASLVDLAIARGTTIILASHVIADVERIADRVVMMHKGRILLDSSIDLLKEEYARLAVRFAGDAPEPPAQGVAGILVAERSRREWVLLTRNARLTNEAFAVGHALGGSRITAIEQLPLCLEDIFVLMIGKEMAAA